MQLSKEKYANLVMPSSYLRKDSICITFDCPLRHYQARADGHIIFTNTILLLQT